MWLGMEWWRTTLRMDGGLCAGGWGLTRLEWKGWDGIGLEGVDGASPLILSTLRCLLSIRWCVDGVAVSACSALF